MDSSDWTASALFSPSKARVQQAQAKDWAAVDSWLAKRYGSRIPAFERNEDTLQALLTLANSNENADEQRNHIERINKAAFQALSKGPSGIAGEVYQAMQAELASETHLDTLAETQVALDCPSSEAIEMARRMVELTSTEFEMTEQMKHTEAQLDAVKAEQRRVRQILNDLNSESFQAPPDVSENTVEWTRSTKHLKAKVAEYEERLSSTRPTSAIASIESVQTRSQEVEQQRAELAELTVQLAAFQDLPTDARAARRKLEDARDGLRSLMERRDRLFESLVER